MIPHSYTYNPGVVLDPLTMTPMITHGGNITVNPLGVPMRPEQKVWQKMFIKNIPQECTNELMQRLLNQFGNVKNFKRTANNRGQLLSFCHFDLETGQEILRLKRLFHNIKLNNNILQLKISVETQNFIKEWMNMQREEWKKKLLAGVNEAKQYDSLQVYHIRDDKKYKQKIEDTLRAVNIEVKKLAADKAKDEQRKEHIREKERDRAKRNTAKELEQFFIQKQDQVLKRQRDKQREYRKEREREREREKQRMRKLEKQMGLQQQQIDRRLHKYLTNERKRYLQKEQDQDLEVMMEENPPLPQEIAEVEVLEEPQPTKKVKAIVEQQIILGPQKVDQVLVEAPIIKQDVKEAPKELKKNQLFEGYEKLYEQKKEDQKQLELNIPELPNQQVDKEQEKRKNELIAELQKKVPQNKMQLWQFHINWDKLSKSVVLQRNIRPWLQEMSNYYMGGVEEKFIALVEKKLLSRSHPDKIIKILKQLLDDDSEEFVIRLWKKLVLQYLKLQNDLV